ncbi:glyceraldehyde-3-phosphate dehydrogenase-like family protein [Actinidia rufa]|uniref:Glyceraldehyde-3-phosphate dehydrogenase-like family protein n=1 Tax=Actinidia rufa TaxID=165716 RepID=A0A7J0H4M9_9ERIC|nr:glyceraldehyde-3-phosphate dehydrogenase-like family protein [Actinidia rufa]
MRKIIDIATLLGRSTGYCLIVLLTYHHDLQEDYEKLLAYPRRVRHESTVGAGLPVIVSLNRILLSGDPIHRIVGSLSGTLGYVMSEVEDGKPFSQVVKSAKSLGYTEPGLITCIPVSVNLSILLFHVGSPPTMMRSITTTVAPPVAYRSTGEACQGSKRKEESLSKSNRPLTGPDRELQAGDGELLYQIEPVDPRDDLSGMDVARKALIIARLLGKRIDLDSIKVESLFPVEMGPNMMPVEAFLENGLPLLDKGIQERVEKASSNGNVLRYVCLIEDSRYEVGIQELPKKLSLGKIARK